MLDIYARKAYDSHCQEGTPPQNTVYIPDIRYRTIRM